MENIVSSNIKIFDTIDGLTRNASLDIVSLLNGFIKIKGTCTIVLSGGNTPKNIYRYISSNFAGKVDWKKVYFFWGDERCVPPDSEESNYYWAYNELLSKIPVPSQNIYRIKGELYANEASADYENSLKKFFFGQKLPSFDIVMLGIGTDGHTASLFPGGRAIEEKVRWVTEDYIEILQSWRITMTMPVFNNSRNILLIACGKDKSNIIKAIFTEENSNSPVTRINPAAGETYLYLDKEASEHLNK